MSRRLERAVTELRRRHPDLDWRFVTFTGQWDPTDDREVTVPGLYRRVSNLFRQFRSVYAQLRAHCGAVAAYVAAEISERGHVHLHCVVLSRWIDPGWLAGLWGAYVDVRALRGVAEVAKYVAKTHSPLDAAWIGGDSRSLIHPRLAARWEVATKRVHLRRSFGELRGLELPEEPPAGRDDCCECGQPVPDWLSELWQPGSTESVARAAARAREKMRWWLWPPKVPGDQIVVITPG